MRNQSLLRSLSFLLPAILLLAACEKESEIKKRPFEVKTKTFYRISPTAPTPVVVNGVTYIGFAFFPGSGNGTATHMGNCSTYFNQLVYTSDPKLPPAGSVAASVTDIPTYPVTGAPLPLIQVGDFGSLPGLINTLHIPAKVYDKIINSVVYNNKGDAVFTSAITGSGGTFPLSPIIVGFNGKAVILGGAGKFKQAVGEINYSGYFNVADPNDAEYNAKGWISY